MDLDSIQTYWHTTIDANKCHFQTEMFNERQLTFWKNDHLAYFCKQCFKDKKWPSVFRTTETHIFVTFL